MQRISDRIINLAAVISVGIAVITIVSVFHHSNIHATEVVSSKQDDTLRNQTSGLQFRKDLWCKMDAMQADIEAVMKKTGAQTQPTTLPSEQR